MLAVYGVLKDFFFTEQIPGCSETSLQIGCSIGLSWHVVREKGGTVVRTYISMDRSDFTRDNF